MHTSTHISTYTSMHMHTQTHVLAYAYMYIHIHTYTHTNFCMHNAMSKKKCNKMFNANIYFVIDKYINFTFNSPDASVVHASGSGQLQANPHVAGPLLSPGKPTRRAVTTMGSNGLVVGDDHMLGPIFQRYN